MRSGFRGVPPGPPVPLLALATRRATRCVHREATGAEVGEALAIYHVGSRFLACADRCPHAGATLSDGELEQGVITCPRHGSQFDVSTGQRLRGPADTDIATYPTLEDGGQLYLLVADEPRNSGEPKRDCFRGGDGVATRSPGRRGARPARGNVTSRRLRPLAGERAEVHAGEQDLDRRVGGVAMDVKVSGEGEFEEGCPRNNSGLARAMHGLFGRVPGHSIRVQ